jgi:hypothetical protein
MLWFYCLVMFLQPRIHTLTNTQSLRLPSPSPLQSKHPLPLSRRPKHLIIPMRNENNRLVLSYPSSHHANILPLSWAIPTGSSSTTSSLLPTSACMRTTWDCCDGCEGAVWEGRVRGGSDSANDLLGAQLTHHLLSPLLDELIELPPSPTRHLKLLSNVLHENLR